MKLTALFSVAATLVFGVPAFADTLTLTFTNANPTVTAPGVIEYTATVTASPDNGAPLFVNGDAFVLNGPYLVDDTPFASINATFAPGQSFTGALFDVGGGLPLTAGIFTGTFSLLGGGDASSLDVLATEPFSLTVSSPTPTATTPEPCSLVLLLSGATLVIGRRKKLD